MIVRDVAASTNAEATVTAAHPAPRFRWAGIVTGIDASRERGRESLALGVGAIASTVVALLTLVVFRL